MTYDAMNHLRAIARVLAASSKPPHLGVPEWERWSPGERDWWLKRATLFVDRLRAAGYVVVEVDDGK